VGDTPIARALARLAADVGFDAAAYGDDPLEVHDDDAAVVVASHGHGEEAALEAALASTVPYVGLVASRTRGAAVRDSLAADTARLRTPAGLDIGARTAEQVALAILAEVVQVRAAVGEPEPEAAGSPHCHHHDA
jgi:xanthine dehydrogenase accessory factor